MRPANDDLDRILAGAHTTTFSADAFTNWDHPTLDDPIPLAAGRLNHDMTRAVCGSGSATVVYSDDWGRSITPQQIDDALSPFGNWIRITAHVRAGAYASDTVVGWFEVNNPKPGSRSRTIIGGVPRTTGEVFTIAFDDAFLGTQREPIDSIVQAPVGGSVIGAVADLLGLPVTASADVAVGGLFEYSTDRLRTVFELVQQIGGTPYMRWDNTVGIRPEAWPLPQGRLTDENDGYLSGVEPAEWDAAKVYNRVVIESEREDQDPIRGVAQILEGRLKFGARRDGAWGRYTLVEKVSGITDQAEADRRASERLAAVSNTRTLGVTWTQPYDPRMEVGDVYEVKSDSYEGLVRIRETALDISSATMKVGAYRG